MRAILIDPMKRTVTRIYDSFEDINIIHYYLQAEVITRTMMGPTHFILLDEFGPMRKDQYWFGFNNIPGVSMAGRGLILALRDDDGYGSCQFDLPVVERSISWFDDPKDAEALMPKARLTDNRGKMISTYDFDKFRTMDKVLVGRDGKVIAYDPERT